MAKVSDVYAGDFVTAAELPPGQRIPAVIVAAASEQIGPEQANKIVLSLQSRDGRNWPRKVVLNKTNATILAATFGDETGSWLRRPIEVWTEKVSFGGRIVDGIRMAPAVPTAPQQPQAARGDNGLATELAARLAQASQPAPAQPSATVIPGTSVGEHLDDEIPF